MKTKIILFLGIIFLLAQACLAAQNKAKPERGHPDGMSAYCFDGDTFKLRDRRIVRLAGIDAPETRHNDKPAQYYSRESRELLQSLLKGKTISITFPGVSNRDRYGRLIANITLPTGESVNELMVRNGAAFFYPHRDLGPEFQEAMLKAQLEAIKERRGMWKYLLDQPLATQTYIGNRASLRFFPADCIAAKRLNPQNREKFDSLMEAFNSGYAPGRVPDGGPECSFWPLEK